jgi:hypothetical protein
MANDQSSVETAGVPMLSAFKGHAPPLLTLIAIEKTNAARLVPLGVVTGQTV